jgi:hypothetical protein
MTWHKALPCAGERQLAWGARGNVRAALGRTRQSLMPPEAFA